MKILICFLFVIILFSCSQESQPILKVYQIRFKGSELSLDGSHRERIEKEDTIMAFNDTIAYKKALISHYSRLIAEELTSNSVSTTSDFKLLDSMGMPVYLNQAIIDSLHRGVKELPSVRKVLGLPYKEK